MGGVRRRWRHSPFLDPLPATTGDGDEGGARGADLDAGEARGEQGVLGVMPELVDHHRSRFRRSHAQGFQPVTT